MTKRDKRSRHVLAFGLFLYQVCYVFQASWVFRAQLRARAWSSALHTTKRPTFHELKQTLDIPLAETIVDKFTDQVVDQLRTDDPYIVELRHKGEEVERFLGRVWRLVYRSSGCRGG